MTALKNERGVVLVFVALGLIIFLLFLGVALDTGWMVYVRSQGQARVDAAALASASALIEKNASTRQTQAEARAERFTDTDNPVLTANNTNGNVQPVHYNPNTGVANLINSWAPATNGDYVNNVGCNGVQVANVVPTPLFFSGVRNAFGLSENGSTNINVTATGYLGCPGGTLVSGTGFAPIALRSCSFDPFPSFCGQEVQLWQNSNGNGGSNTSDNSVWTTLFETANNPNCEALASGAQTPAQVDTCETINTNNGVTNCICTLKNRYQSICSADICDNGTDAQKAACTVKVPVVDTGCGGNAVCGTATNNASSGTVVGWAKLCLTKFYSEGGPCKDPDETPNPCTDKSSVQCLFGQLACDQGGIPGSYTGGQCFGTAASNPILIR